MTDIDEEDKNIIWRKTRESPPTWESVCGRFRLTHEKWMQWRWSLYDLTYNLSHRAGSQRKARQLANELRGRTKRRLEARVEP